MAHRLVALITLFLLIAPFGPTAAEDEADSYGEPPSPTLHGALRLSLDEAVSMSMENNLDIQVDRYAPLIAFEESEVAWGAYDPEGFGNVSRTFNAAPTANAIFGDRTESTIDGGGVGVRTLIPYLNGTFAVEFDGDRTESFTDVTSLRPAYNTGLVISGSIPVMRNLIWSAPWTQIETSEILHGESLDRFTTAVMDTVTETERAYWNLVAQEERLHVAEKSLETRKALLDQVQIQYEVGVVSKVDVVEAEAGLAEGDVLVIRAENFYRKAQDDLIDLVLGRHLTAGSRLEIDPTDRPEDYVEYEINVESAVAKAFGRRPEIASARKEIHREEVELRFAKNQRLPSVSIEGSYGWAGLGGTPRDTAFSAASGPTTGFGDSLTDWGTDEGGENYSIGAVISIPLGNIEGRHNVSKAKLELRRAKTRLKRLEQDIILQVRDGARNLKSAQEGIEAAERKRLAAAEQLRAERIRLEHGESTPFDVLQREEILVESESQKINALQLYRNSVAELHRAQGTTLEARNVVIGQVMPIR